MDGDLEGDGCESSVVPGGRSVDEAGRRGGDGSGGGGSGSDGVAGVTADVCTTIARICRPNSVSVEINHWAMILTAALSSDDDGDAVDRSG